MSYDGWLEAPYTDVIEPDEEDCSCKKEPNFPCPVHDPYEYMEEMREDAALRKAEIRQAEEEGY